MKSILLASASIAAVAIAGVAQAEVSFGGEVTVGYNDDPAGDNDGFYYDGNIAVTLSQDLGNGLTASAVFDFDFFDNNLGQTLESGGVLVSLESETAGFYFGDITSGSAMSDFAAISHWMDVGETDADAFSEADGETVLAGWAAFGPATVAISYILDDQEFEWDTDLSDGDDTGPMATRSGTGDLVQLSLGGTFVFGNFTVGLAYQEEISDAKYFSAQIQEDGTTLLVPLTGKDVSADEVFGISGSTTLAGATVKAAYAANSTTDEDSFGIGIDYPFGPVTLMATYATNSGSPNFFTIGGVYDNGAGLVAEAEFKNDDDDTTDASEYSVDVAYEVLTGVTLLAGFSGGEVKADDELDSYVAVATVLGEGATLTASYGTDDDDSEEDEIGGPEFQKGATVELGFTF